LDSLLHFILSSYFIVQGHQKVSVRLTITVHHQVHRDFLITLCYNY